MLHHVFDSVIAPNLRCVLRSDKIRVGRGRSIVTSVRHLRVAVALTFPNELAKGALFNGLTATSNAQPRMSCVRSLRRNRVRPVAHSVLPPSFVRLLLWRAGSRPLSKLALHFITAVMNYLATELVDLAVNDAFSRRTTSKAITLSTFLRALSADEELAFLFRRAMATPLVGRAPGLAFGNRLSFTAHRTKRQRKGRPKSKNAKREQDLVNNTKLPCLKYSEVQRLARQAMQRFDEVRGKIDPLHGRTERKATFLSRGAIKGLRAAAEHELIAHMVAANALANVSGRATVTAGDVAAVSFLRREWNDCPIAQQ